MEGAPNAKMTQTEEYVSGGKPDRGSENAETAETTPAPAENKAEVQPSEVLTQPADSVQIAAPEKRRNLSRQRKRKPKTATDREQKPKKRNRYRRPQRKKRKCRRPKF